MKIKRILVPVDFSAHSLSALDYAADFARPFKAELLVLHVVEPIYYTVPDFTGGAAASMVTVIEQQRQSARTELVGLERRYAKRRVKLRTLLQTGIAAYQAVVSSAKKLRADMIIMATHGRTGLTHLLMGSVAEHVVRAAPCPVLTLRAGKGPRRRPAAKRARRRPAAKPATRRRA
jgi:nucleotide-binding universal stress UspA family protein